MTIKKYISLGFWNDKETKEDVTRIAEVHGGTSKSGKKYEFVDTSAREKPISGAFPAGTILQASISFEPTNSNKFSAKASATQPSA